MRLPDDKTSRIQRSFHELPDKAAPNGIEEAYLLAQMGWQAAFGWNELLKSQRVLIISEAGAGKTYECHAQQRALSEAGEAAFFFELAELSRNNLHDLLLPEESKRFNAWLTSQSD